MAPNSSVVRGMLVAITALVIGGCAAAKPPSGDYSGAESDPWEPYNRNMQVFNNRLDRVTTRPLALGYKKITPQWFRNGVSNVMDNLGYPIVFVNDFLQGKFKQGGLDFLRFGINSTLGVGGIFDAAARFDLAENNEDFGQTLAKWGVPSGPYLVLPIFGPSTLRDGPAQAAGFVLDGRNYIGGSSEQDKLLVIDIIDARTRLLAAEGLLNDSFDPYLTLRESWLQRRQYLIYDGDPPLDEDDEFLDEFMDEEELADEPAD